MQRRHDLDALRVIAFGLLILYHVGMVYVHDWDFHIKSPYQAEWLQWPMIVLNRWRMPLLFAISGMAIGLWQPERAPLRFALQRTWRLLLPLAFGMLFVVSVQAYCEARANGAVAPGYIAFMVRYLQLRPWPEGGWTGADFGVTWNHLWYLAYLWVYTMIVVALQPLLSSRPGRRAQAWFGGRARLWPLLSPAALLFAYLVWLKPRFPDTHALFDDWYLHAEFFTVFLFGYLAVRGEEFWNALRRLRWPLLAVAAASIGVELSLKALGILFDGRAIPAWAHYVPWYGIERAARAMYTWSALLAIFGWGYALLNRPFRWLPYATEAVYPWYILHQSLIVPLAFVLIPLRLGPVLEPALVLGGTVAGCLVLHEFVIRRVGVLRPLFGMKKLQPRERLRDIAQNA